MSGTGMTNDTFTPFFSTRTKVKNDNSKVFVSYYDTPKAWIVVVSNYMEETDQPVALDLTALTGSKAKNATDAWHDMRTAYDPKIKTLDDALRAGTKYPINDGKITLTVPALSPPSAGD